MRTAFLVPVLCVAVFIASSAAKAQEQFSTPELKETIMALDAAVFDAFNHCDDPAQLAKHGNFFDENVEFYHDTGGVTWTRNDMLANTSKYVCGQFTRELIADSFIVHPIKNFGAISQGSHRFCQRSRGKCEGMAEFTMVWKNEGGLWKVTRVLSYGHRENVDKL